MENEKKKKKIHSKALPLLFLEKNKFLTYAVPYFLAESKYGDLCLGSIVLGK